MKKFVPQLQVRRPTVPCPVHVQGIKFWASTKIKLKKWRGKDLFYYEFIVKVFNHDEEAGQYAKWILAHYSAAHKLFSDKL